jgi:hypothetical protein
MKVKKEFIMFARRLHNGLRQAIENGDVRTDDDWLKEERPYFEHYSCGIYLNGCLSFLEGKYGVSCWNKNGKTCADFDSFIQTLGEREKNIFNKIGISKKGLDALICIRNSITHNNNDVSLNNDKTCVDKINNAKIIGVTLNDNIVSLTSNYEIDFMEYVRLSFIAVSMYYDGLTEKLAD